MKPSTLTATLNPPYQQPAKGSQAKDPRPDFCPRSCEVCLDFRGRWGYYLEGLGDLVSRFVMGMIAVITWLIDFGFVVRVGLFFWGLGFRIEGSGLLESHMESKWRMQLKLLFRV